MKIIILQLARLGDILQTLPAIQGLKKKYPDSEITLVVRSTFASAARLSPHVDKLVEFPSQTVLGPALHSKDRKAESLANLANWISSEVLPHDGSSYDLLANFTYSLASSYLASIIPAKTRFGMHRTLAENTDTLVLTDPWSQYIYTNVLGNSLNSIHLNDLFMRVVGATNGGWPLEVIQPPQTVKTTEKKPDQLRIGIQVTASRENKTLKVNAWAEVCREILKKHRGAELIFFGSNADLATIKRVVKRLEKLPKELRHSPIQILAGTMPFEENLHWVKTCDWLIGPDSALAHLSSIAGIKTLQISVGPVRPQETGPYGNGHHVIYPLNANDSELAIDVATVLAGETASKHVAEATTRLVKCNDGSFRNDLTPRNYVPEETSNFFEKAYYLLAEFRCSGRQEDIDVPVIGDRSQPGALDRLVNLYDVLCTTRQVADHGRHYCVELLKDLDNRPRVKELMEKIADVDLLLTKVQNSIPLVKPLIDTWRVAKDIPYANTFEAYERARTGAIEVEEVLGIAEGSYRELCQNVEIVQQLLQTAVDAAQKRLSQKVSSAPRSATEPKERVVSNENDSN